MTSTYQALNEVIRDVFPDEAEAFGVVGEDLISTALAGRSAEGRHNKLPNEFGPELKQAADMFLLVWGVAKAIQEIAKTLEPAEAPEATLRSALLSTGIRPETADEILRKHGRKLVSAMRSELSRPVK